MLSFFEFVEGFAKGVPLKVRRGEAMRSSASKNSKISTSKCFVRFFDNSPQKS